MFGFKKPKQPTGPSPDAPMPEEGNAADQAAAQPERKGLFSRLRSGLTKTGRVLTTDIGELLSRKIDDELLEELETRLLMADVGVEATNDIISDLTARVARKQLDDAGALMKALHQDMVSILQPCAQPLQPDGAQRPYVVLVVGINGAGKTTTIGKLARRLQTEGRSVMLAAGDTFRAAAIEQLQVWGERNAIPVVAQGTGADSASVIFDGLQAARARGADILIADTAGRLHTQSNLMDELRKVKRVLTKLDESAPHEVLLVVDAGTGQNALNQAKEFNEALGVTGLVVTKLDGTAKGGILFAMAKKLGIPIRFVGVGEKIEDLQVFDPEAFVTALLAGSEG